MTQTSLISIVDDDLSVLEATTSLLESHGYTTAAFASAQEFLQSPQVGDTTCLVTDVRMPGVSGIDLQERLIGAGHRIPTIVNDRTWRRARAGGGTEARCVRFPD